MESSSSSFIFDSDKSFLTTPIKQCSSTCPVISTPDPSHPPPCHTRPGCNKSALPPRYEILCEFFNAMISSIRLLRLKRLPASLADLTRSIESLTNRRFTLHHLAQLKHILPEVIVVEKIRVLDERTRCMKEELLVLLDNNATEIDRNGKASAGYSHLKRMFRARIADFAATHPEGEEDVPKGEIPELFYKLKQENEPGMDQSHVFQPTTLTSPSFKQRFSSRALRVQVSEPSVARSVPESPIKQATSTPVNATPVKGGSTPAKPALHTPAKWDSTPAKFASTPARLMAATPALHTPKRCLATVDDATDIPNTSANRRALKFDDDIDVQVKKDLLEVLPENLLHSLMEKERRAVQEQDPAVSQAQRRKQLMAGVLKLVDMIKLLFPSVRRSVMTKEELIHKIIAGHLDIVDKGEVEAQLQLLQEVAPEFITEQSCLSGDTVLHLNNYSCAESVRAKLQEAC